MVITGVTGLTGLTGLPCPMVLGLKESNKERKSKNIFKNAENEVSFDPGRAAASHPEPSWRKKGIVIRGKSINTPEICPKSTKSTKAFESLCKPLKVFHTPEK